MTEIYERVPIGLLAIGSRSANSDYLRNHSLGQKWYEHEGPKCDAARLLTHAGVLVHEI